MAQHLKNNPLTPTEIEAFDEFLSECHGSIQSFEALDGLFCALICAPHLVPIDQYLAVIMDQTDTFKTEQQSREVLEWMMRHGNTIEDELRSTVKTDNIYVPPLIMDEEGVTLGNEWAAGFMLGVSLSDDGSWSDLMDHETLSQLLVPMMMLAHEHHPDPEIRSPAILAEAREELLESMFEGLANLFAYFQKRRRGTGI
ncbi:YecA family protein [Zwartia sp.]|uniref:YecA family protein n=1 Tax=Zwartia sp. TaxID=2978004 RepID=UPI003BB18346